MTYSHTLKKTKDVPDEQWGLFSNKVKQVFNLLPSIEGRDGLDYCTGYPLTICSSDGLNVIKDGEELFRVKFGISFLSFNGDSHTNMDYETFTLRNKGKQSVLEQCCKTDNKPYDFFVIAVLILVHNLCPKCFKIISDGDLDDWQPVQHWLCQILNSQFELPVTIQ